MERELNLSCVYWFVFISSHFRNYSGWYQANLFYFSVWYSMKSILLWFLSSFCTLFGPDLISQMSCQNFSLKISFMFVLIAAITQPNFTEILQLFLLLLKFQFLHSTSQISGPSGADAPLSRSHPDQHLKLLGCW